MALKVNNVAVAIFGPGVQEMVERDLIQSCGRGEGRDVPSDAAFHLVGTYHHRHRIPPDETLDPALHLLASWKRGLLADGNRILIRSGSRERKIDARSPSGMELQLLQKTAGALRAACRQNVIQGIQPLAGFEYL